jgi:hypothetical protein
VEGRSALAYSAATLKELSLPLQQYIRESGYALVRAGDEAACKSFERDIYELLTELGSIIDEMEEYPHNA